LLPAGLQRCIPDGRTTSRATCGRIEAESTASLALMRQRKLDLLSLLSTLTQLTDGRFHRILIFPRRIQ
jgi:hypothetical protein